MATKTIPVNNYNDSDNYGTSGAAPSLYSDKHYLDGDGFLYGLGMASQRMIVKGKGDDIDTDHFAWTSASTMGKLILRVDSLVGSGLVSANNSSRLAVNPGNGLYIDMINQNKLAVSLFKKQKTPQSTPYNASGLEFATGAEWGGAPAAGQLRIKLADLSTDGTNFDNVSGLILQDPYDTESGATQFHGTGGLKVNYGDGLTLDNSLKLTTALYTKKSGNKNESGLIIASNSTTYTSGLKINYGTGLKLNTNGQLVVDSTAIVPNIFPSNSITIDESGNNKTIKVKLRPTADGVYSWSGLKVYDTADAYGGIGLSIDINRSTHGDNPLDIDDGGLFVNWERMLSNFASSSGGNLSYYTDGNGHFGISVVPGQGLKNNSQSKNLEVKPKPNSGIGVDSNGVYLKVASTSEIGGVKTGTPATIPETNTVDIPLFLDSNNVGWVRTNVFTQKAPVSGSAGEFPYSASYIDTNYSTKTEVTAEIASAVSDISGREYKIFPKLPAKGESQSWADFYAAYKKYIALVLNGGTEPDAYKEYILIVTNEDTGECHWEQIGDTEFTTDNFVAKTDILTKTEVDNIIQDVFGF